MKKRTGSIVASVLAVLAIVLIASALHVAKSHGNPGVCEARMLQDYQHGVTRTERPPECKGLSDTRVQEIAASVMDSALSQPAPAATSEDFLIDVARLSPELLNERSGAFVRAQGRTVCRVVSQGGTEGDAALEVMDSGLSMDQATTVTAAALKDYCPS